MAGVAVTVASLAIYALYDAAVTEQREQLRHLAQSQARAVEAIARHETKENPPQGVIAATLEQITEVHQSMAGFGRTGDFLVGQRKGDSIILRSNHSHPTGRGTPGPVPFESDLAEPMRRALQGQSGTMIGLDYAGIMVLAAHEPVADFNLGIVAKIDITELQEPFVKVGAISAAGGLVILLLGAACFRRIKTLLVESLEAHVEDLKDAQRIAQVGNWNWEVETDKACGSEETIRLFGMEPNSFDGSFNELLDAIHPDDGELVRNAIHRTLKGKPLDIEHRIVMPTGIERIVNMRGEVILDEKGRATFISGTIQDITERKRAEEDLRESEASLANAQRIARLGNWEWNVKTDSRWWSDEHYRMFGLDQGQPDLSFETFLNRIHPEDRTEVRSNVERAIREGSPFENEYRIVGPDGCARVIRGLGEVTLNDDGIASRVFGTVQDITKQKQAEEALRAAHDELELRVVERTQELTDTITELRHTEAALSESEALLRAFADYSPSTYSIKDSQGRYTLTNRVQDFGAKADVEDVLGKTAHDVFPKETADLIVASDKEVLETGQIIEQEHEWKDSDAARTVLRTKFPIRNSAGEVEAVGTIGSDITARKRVEEALRDSEERMHLVADAVPALISYVDSTLHYRFVNELFKEWYGVDAEDAVGNSVRDVMGEKFFNQVAHRFEAALAGQEVDYEDSFEYEDGSVRYFHASYSPHFGEDGEVLGYFALTYDISESKQAEEELRIAKEQADAANLAKSQFLSSMSHELRTPLNAILGFGQLLGHDPEALLDDKRREYAEIILDSGQHLLNLINEVLELAKIESGALSVAMENVELDDIFQECLTLI
ncbi:MAG: PAS domain S-box protein, partial [Rhodospirillales bacterium]|nr:PAS domain S-box protein [Rhodospirillales bacterium]